MLAMGFLLVASLPGAQAQLSISNDTLRVDFNTASSQFAITRLADSLMFVPSAQFTNTGGTASLRTATNPTFGVGPMIDLVYPMGRHDDIMLFTNLPFALFQSTLSNATAQTVVSNMVPVVSLTENWGESSSNLVVVGTGGIIPATNKNPGSFEWLALVDPTNRNGVVNGWITDDRATGVVFDSTTNGQTTVSAREDFGNLPIPPGQGTTLETFGVGYFDDGRIGLETWASTIAQVYDIHLPPQPSGYCTFQASPYGGPGTAASTAELSDFAATNNLPAFGFSIVQMDGRWEAGVIPSNGPPHDFSMSNPTNGYPDGMQPTASYIASDGLTPGLWLEPFSGTYFDPIFTNHLDWFVHSNTGGPYNVVFGGTELDMTYQPARNYVSNIIQRITQQWGYRYLKLDALYAGAGVPGLNDTGYVNDNMGITVFSVLQPNIQTFRSGLELLRQAAGSNVFLLGCNTPDNMHSYGGSFGLVDGMRIGRDNGPEWSEWTNSPTYGSRHYFLHGRIWYNDPDTVYVRDSFDLNSAQTIASWYGITGQLTLDSDWMPDLSSDRLDMLKRILPPHGLLPRPVDYFEHDPPLIWLLTDTRHPTRRDVIGLFNWSDLSSQEINVPIAHIGLPATNYVGYDFWSNTMVPSISGNLQMTLPPNSCSVLAVRPVSARPQLISTSRHITQGVVDVLAESWNQASHALNGQSQLVGSDPYELRIVVPDETWQASSAVVSGASQAAGITVSYSQSGNLVRVTLSSPVSRAVSWSVGFSSGTSALPVPQIAGMARVGNTLLLSGTNGIAGGQYFVLASSNLAAGPPSWQVVTTNNFDPGGNLSLTYPINPGAPQTFLRVELP